jgi:hypothetical protein
MTLPKKERRTIEVDGVTYHYRIRLHKSERAVIQHSVGQGACLFVFPHSIMRPKHVADTIRFAIKRGWKPGKTGEDFWFAFDSNDDGETLLESIPNDDFRVATYNTMGEMPENDDRAQYADTRKWYDREIVPDKLI